MTDITEDRRITQKVDEIKERLIKVEVRQDYHDEKMEHLMRRIDEHFKDDIEQHRQFNSNFHKAVDDVNVRIDNVIEMFRVELAEFRKDLRKFTRIVWLGAGSASTVAIIWFVLKDGASVLKLFGIGG